MLNPDPDFGSFDGRTWLDCAHQGPLPRVACDALLEMLRWKRSPALMEDERFYSEPDRLRETLARLVGSGTDEIVLGNSTSYGLHLIANGIDWREGDEVLVVRGDFPASVLPFLMLRDRGVEVRELDPAGPALTASDVEVAITPRTRLLSATWVNSFTGYAIDLDEIGAVCRARGVLTVVNGSQAVGVRPIDVTRTPIDALASCGFKWLLGPYATGFAWLGPELREVLECRQAYWLTAQRGRPLDDMRTLDPDAGAGNGVSCHDVFCTANFFNFVPWRISIDYLLAHGIDAAAAHVDTLVERLFEGLERRGYRVVSPCEGSARSSLAFCSHADASRNAAIHVDLRAAGIDIGLREGSLRVSPHLYNVADDVDRLLDALP